MPEGVTTSTGSTSNGSAAVTTGQGTGTSTTTAEPKITYGHPDAIRTETQDTDRQESTEQVDASTESEFGDEPFDDIESGTEEYTSTFPKEFSEALTANPKQAEKMAKRWYFENGRYKAIPGFESPEKAREIVDRLETLGGLDGIESETREAATLWNMLGAGDAGILDTLEKEYAEGLKKLAPAVIDRYQKLDPAGWNHSMAQVFMATVQQGGGVDAINLLSEIPELVKNPAAKQALQKLISLVENINGIATTAPRTDLTPEAAKLKEQKQQLDQQGNALYQREVASRTTPMMRTAGMNELSKILKGKNISAEAKQALLGDIVGTKDNPVGEFGRLMRKNEGFQANAKALLAAGETEKFIKLFQSAMTRTMPLAVRNMYKKYTGIGGNADVAKQRQAEGSARRESGGGSSAGNTIKTATPRAETVDWSRMRSEFGRDKAENMFLWDRKYYKKGDKDNVYSY